MHYEPFTNVYRLSCSNMSLMPFFLFGTENFRENISFVKTQTRLKILCIFLGFVGVAKGKVGRKVYSVTHVDSQQMT